MYRLLSMMLLTLMLAGCFGGSSGTPSTLLPPPATDGDELADSESPGEQPPDDTRQAIAGPDLRVPEGAFFTVQGSSRAKDEDFVRRVLWYQPDTDYRLQLGEDQQPDQNMVTFRAPMIDQPQVELTLIFEVETAAGLVADDTLTVTVTSDQPRPLPLLQLNAPPVVTGGSSVLINSQATSDRTPLSYQWRQLAGPAIAPEQELNQDSLAFIAPHTDGVNQLKLELAAEDTDGRIGYARTLIMLEPAPANRAPIITDARANPGVATARESVLLEAQAKDPDGDPVTFSWQHVGDAPFEMAIRNADQSRAEIVLPDLNEAVTLKFRVDVSDGALNDSRMITLQAIPRSEPSPGLLDCLLNPFQRGCPLQVMNDLFGDDGLLRCDDPFSADCPLAIISRLNPQLGDCLKSPSMEHCMAVLGSLADPLQLLSYLPEPQHTLSCNPAFDEPSFSHFSGVMHGHTGYSDGAIGTTPRDALARVKAEGQQFFGISDHSDNVALPMTVTGDCLDTLFLACLIADRDQPFDSFRKWFATQEQVDAISDGNFTGFRGFEWTSDRFGHINVFFSKHVINAKTGPGYAVSMARFWQWFTYPSAFGGGSDGLLVFNHPGREDLLEDLFAPAGGDPAYAFNQFAYIPGADYRAVGVEVFGKGSEYDSDGPGGSWLAYALDRGWHLGVIGSEDHHGTSWGNPSLPKTVFIARSLDPMDLKEAMLSRRMYAVAQFYNDLRLTFSIDGAPMGSRIRQPAGSQLSVTATIERDGTPFEAIFELVTQGNTMAASASGHAFNTAITVGNQADYYFLRIRDPKTGRPVAFASPIWVMPGDAPLSACHYEGLDGGLFGFNR